MRDDIGELRAPFAVLLEAASISEYGGRAKLITSLMASQILKTSENLVMVGGCSKPNEI
jgi:hypothetical protein